LGLIFKTNLKSPHSGVFSMGTSLHTLRTPSYLVPLRLGLLVARR
jgi:hypothetical protein